MHEWLGRSKKISLPKTGNFQRGKHQVWEVLISGTTLADDVQVNGVTLHYYRTGGDKPPVVLAHGFSDNGLCWTPVAEILETDYDVIMPDARGHGRSARIPAAPSEEVGWEMLADDLAGLIAALELDRPALLGHSMGAATAALVAARYPERTRAILLEDPPWRDAPPDKPTEEKEPDKPEHTMPDWLRDPHSKTRAELIAECRQDNPAWSLAEIEPWADAKRQFDPHIFTEITCPTLLITADTDKSALVTPEVAQEVKRLIPDLRIEHIAGAGHSIRREQFEPYITAITKFLKDVMR
jgi:pimeloyl-ACP methyl ester carboxylesterase